MMSQEEVQRARVLVGGARDFLNEHGDGAAVVMSTFEFESGALFALEWVLGLGGHRAFTSHLKALEYIRKELTHALEP